jgi:hypothetical protein
MVVDELIGASLIKPVEVANSRAAEGMCHWHACATCCCQMQLIGPLRAHVQACVVI